MYYRKRLDIVKTYVNSIINRDSSWAESYRTLAFINYFEKNHTDATKHYYRFLKEINSLVILDDALRMIKMILPGPELERIYKMSADYAGDYLLHLIKKRDPDPQTEENERLTEYFNRLIYSLTYFRRNDISFDERGEWYLKFGEPDRKYTYRESPVNGFA